MNKQVTFGNRCFSKGAESFLFQFPIYAHVAHE